MDYAKPLYAAGVGSDNRTCGRVIKQILDALAYPELRFHAGEDSFESDCKRFRIQLFTRLRQSGWVIHHSEQGLEVSMPRKLKPRKLGRENPHDCMIQRLPDGTRTDK